MVRTESSKDYSEFIVAQETGSTVQKYDRSKKTTVFDFPKAEGVVHFSSDYCIIKRQVLAEGSLSTEHNNGGKKGTLACQQKVISSYSGKTGPNGSINRSDRSTKDVIVGCHQEEKHDIIHIKVPRLSYIFSKVRFASNLPNSKSDRIVSVDTSTYDMIVSNPRRSIEEGNLLASKKNNFR